MSYRIEIHQVCWSYSYMIWDCKGFVTSEGGFKTAEEARARAEQAIQGLKEAC